MTTTIDTSSNVTATVQANQRKLARCQNGVLWAVFFNGAGNFEFHYSTNDGAAFTHDSAGNVASGGTTNGPDVALFIDLDDYGHLVYKNGTDGIIYYRRGTLNAARTAWTWAPAETVRSGASGAARYPDVVAHREGTGWTAHFVWSHWNGSTDRRVEYKRANITSTGTVTFSTSSGGATSATTAESIRSYATTGDHTMPVIDFHHTGDAKTVSGGTPHLFVAWSDSTGTDVLFKRATYATGNWRFGTERTLDSASYAAASLLSGAFDGSRFVAAFADSASTGTAKVVERDAADTTTSARTPPALSDGTLTALSVSYDGDQDIHLWVVGGTSDDVSRVAYDRSAGSWGSWATEATADALAGSLTLKRGYSDQSIDAIYTTGTASPYSIAYDTLALNRNPTAATWDLTDNQAHDVASTLTLDWTFNDPDAGDTQSKYALRRQIGAASAEYWNAGTTSWGATEVENTSSTTQVALASSWGSDGDANHKYAVKTWDAAGLEGSYSSELTVIPSAKDNPTISSPADAGTVTAPSVTATWSAATQTAYKARLLTSGSAELESSGWVTSTNTSHSFAYTLENSTSYKVEVTTKNDEGLASDADTNSFTVSFTPPATPTLVVTGSDANGYITVAITNPGTGATESSNDVYVRVASGGRQDIDRTVNDDGIRIAAGVAVDGSFIDRAVTGGVDYEYRVKAIADTGATAWSAWT